MGVAAHSTSVHPQGDSMLTAALSPHRLARSIARFIALVALSAAGAAAQSTAVMTIAGTVVDAGSSQPLIGARVILTPETSGVFGVRGATSDLPTTRSTISDDAGSYTIKGVPAARYRLHVRRIGYEPSLVEIDLRQSDGTARVSVGLVVVPVRLAPIRVDGPVGNTFGSLALPNDSGSLRIEAVRDRQSRFLATDVRELTAASALEAGSTGDVDLFRALRRFPGVTGYDDRSAELWIRGGRWDQVRVAYDGLPIFNPLHATGTMSGIGGDAIGAAFLHPGVRPVSSTPEGASLIDVRSRAATDSGVTVTGEATRVGIASSVQVARADGRSGLAVSAKRSFSDISMPLNLGWNADLRGGWFTELALRGDRVLDNGKALEFSLLRSYDYHRAFTQTARPFSGGSFLTRATLRIPMGRWMTAHTVGMSNYSSSDQFLRGTGFIVDTLHNCTIDTIDECHDYIRALAIDSTDVVVGSSSVDYLSVEGTARRPGAGGETWSVGYRLSQYNASSALPLHAISWAGGRKLNLASARDRLPLGALWTERRWQLSRRLTGEAGIRVESNLASPAPLFAPSLQARYRLDNTTMLSAGLSRTHQHTQELAATYLYGSNRGMWLLSANGRPPVTTTQAGLGVERWLAAGIVISANAYGRQIENIATTALPGDDSTALFVPADLRAAGAEFEMRRIAGRLTGSVSYSLSRATESIAGRTTVASGDRTHTLDLSAMLRLGPFRLGGAATSMTGSPFTRVVYGHGYLVSEDSVDWKTPNTSGPRNGERMPTYFTADLFAEWSGRIGRVQLSPFVGLRNLTGRHNLTSYLPRPDTVEPTDHPSETGFYAADRSFRRANLGLRIVF